MPEDKYREHIVVNGSSTLMVGKNKKPVILRSMVWIISELQAIFFSKSTKDLYLSKKFTEILAIFNNTTLFQQLGRS